MAYQVQGVELPLVFIGINTDDFNLPKYDQDPITGFAIDGNEIVLSDWQFEESPYDYLSRVLPANISEQLSEARTDVNSDDVEAFNEYRNVFVSKGYEISW